MPLEARRRRVACCGSFVVMDFRPEKMKGSREVVRCLRD